METTTENTRRRQAWLAVVLSIIMPGVGHVYCGKLIRGLVFGLCYGMAIPIVLGLLASMNPTSTIVFAFLMVAASFGVVVAAAVDACRLARRTRVDYTPKAYNHAAVYVLIGVMIQGSSVGYALHIRGSLFEAFRIPTASGFPTIAPGDRVLANKQAYKHTDPAVGDVVVFHPPTEQWRWHWLKRIVAVAGDTVEIRDGVLYINGDALPQRRIGRATARTQERDDSGRVFEGEVFEETNGGVSYRVFLAPSPHGPAPDMSAVTVPENHCFVMGANRNNSTDSRHFGPIPYSVIEGRADYIYWPAADFSRFGRVR